LVVTPESSIPLASEELDPELKSNLSAPFSDGRRAALVGIFVGDEQAGYSNALVGLTDRNGLADPLGYRYVKRHLLPFGEYVPSGFDWFVAMMNIPIGQQVPGANASSLAVANQRVRPLICYEDLFGEDFVESVVGEAAATVLVNASNFAWFGSWRPSHFEFSQAQHQHLQVSRLRAMEFQRPVLRASNTGATTAIDHKGQVKARLPSDVEGRLEITVDGRVGATPYATWLSLWGLWPLVALALAGLVAAAAGSAIRGKQCEVGQPLETATGG
jgi:apolipoprotein N-acyltransferase